MTKYTAFQDLKTPEDKTVWILVNNYDLCNCIAQPVNANGQWTLCLNPNCKDNELGDLRILI